MPRPHDTIRGGPDVVQKSAGLVVESAEHPQPTLEIHDRLIDPLTPVSLDVFGPGQTIGGRVSTSLGNHPQGIAVRDVRSQCERKPARFP